MRSNFEKSASALIKVDPYIKSMKKINNQRTAQNSALDYKAGRGNTGVDLRWHTPSEYSQLTKDQMNELRVWQQTPVGKDVLSKPREEFQKKRKVEKGKDIETPKKRNEWLNKYVKKASGRAHVMSLIAKINIDEKEIDKLAGNIVSVNVCQSILQSVHTNMPPIPDEKLDRKLPNEIAVGGFLTRNQHR